MVFVGCEGYDWVIPTAEETWHNHAEGNLIVALKSMNIAPEASQAARLLKAIPSSRLVIMAAYHWAAPAPSTGDASFLEYLQKPPDAGPAVGQTAQGVQNWKCAGRRLVEIRGKLPTVTALLGAFTNGGHMPRGKDRDEKGSKRDNHCKAK